MKNIKSKKGFGLIEMIVGVAIVSIGIVGTFSMISRFSYQSQVIRDSFIASNLAQEGIEIVKNIRDTNALEDANWNDGLTHCQSGCEMDYTNDSLLSWSGDGRYLYLNNNGGYTYNSAGAIETYYKRRITITEVEPNKSMEIIVSVYWESSQTTLVSKIYNWWQ
ncbi:MAG: prepilin-type N-terminal cleavage/methylation domain-containing protein [Candidatus Pacebacteria bacterium]|nr:prepilin-type N-terminal cleavage/methylation domain-containing protein [Candidatus Paceibacterota bacterium]MDD2757548.1 prepilin-type N-terminal cleavage/methylation domain-containing protein [Candidatus Paceibacterota bacterium]MDD3283739.1 prepilin-type N-terminal cleavage/methylation domain-containing protein [Candidatus Paceibacterota bacterium]MDD3969871.1 prepilin-type N-terminal cleavage/methylation domain-containing protein [Candidatus Paceibacterota bacterium]MDD4738001.1 prepilin